MKKKSIIHEDKEVGKIKAIKLIVRLADMVYTRKKRDIETMITLNFINQSFSQYFYIRRLISNLIQELRLVALQRKRFYFFGR